MAGRVTLGIAIAARIAVPAQSREEAIRAACAPLVRIGALTQHYEDRCVAILDEQGPYIVLAPGIALAHARPEDGARQLALAAVTLAHPVAFGHPQNDPVDVVIAFGSPDAQRHTGLLASLAKRLTAGLADDLRAATGDEQAVRLLQEVTDDAV